jgi:hypothetical protein
MLGHKIIAELITDGLPFVNILVSTYSSSHGSTRLDYNIKLMISSHFAISVVLIRNYFQLCVKL